MRTRKLIRLTAVSLLIFAGSTSAQLSYSISQQSPPCFNISNSITAVVTVTPPGAVSFSWSIGPAISICVMNNTIIPGMLGTSAAVKFGCCGSYSLVCSAYNSNNSLITSTTMVASVFCPPTINANANPPMVCPGGTANVAATGGNTYTWSFGSTGSPVTFTPSGPGIHTVTGTAANGCSNTKTVSVNVYTPNFQVIPDQTICVGSAITLTAGGAQSYTWSNGSPFPNISVSPNVTTSYTVSATSASANINCTSTKTVVVNVGSGLTITAVASPTTVCEGGQVTLSASGANTFTWSTFQQGSTITVIAPTGTNSVTYTVVGASGNCGSNMVSITVPLSPGPNISVVPSKTAVCAGENVTLTASGAQGYTWYNNLTATTITLTPVNGTNYSVTGQNQNGCQGVGNVSVVVNPLPTISIASSKSVVCSGETVTLTASGAQTYTWSNTAVAASITLTPLNGPYSVTGQDINGCKNTAGYTMVVNPAATITAASSRTNICQGEKIILTPGGGTSYTWSPVAGSGSLLLTPSVSVQYSLTGSNSAGCTAKANVSVTVNKCVGLEEKETGIGMNIFPNPACNELTVETNEGGVLTIVNQCGQTVMKFELPDTVNKLDLSTLEPGCYFTIFQSVNSTRFWKLIKQ